MLLAFNWKGVRVLVTGGTGFIGSWLTEALVSKGADVTVLVKTGDPIGISSLKHLAKKIKISKGDINDLKSVTKALKNQELVFHLAAITQVLYAIKNPFEALRTNIGGTMNVLEAIRNNNAENFLIFASTDKVYGEPQYLPIDEVHPLSSKSPYDATKLAADRLVYAYHLTYGLRSSIVRWSNTYGGRDSNILRAGPDFITTVINKKPPVVRGHGRHVRDFMYVSDAVDGILAVAENSKVSNGETFNLGTGKPLTVEEFARLVIKLSAAKDVLLPIILNKPTPGEIEKQYLSYKKAKEKLGWQPKVNLEEGVKLTIKWYTENQWWQDVIKKVGSFYDVSKIIKSFIE